MNNFIYYNPTAILFGRGQADAVGERMAPLGRNILLLSGGASAERSGLLDRIREKLRTAGVAYTELSGVRPNPVIEKVREGAALCKSKRLDAVLSVGGGSVLDSAKVIASAARYEGDPWDLLAKKIKPANPLPLGCVLTLAATGSEANGNAVISNPATAQKLAWCHPHAYPRFSILDPELTFTVPREHTAYGAVDIMAHVFEQYFHDVPATPLQDGVAETILRTVIANAPIAMARPDDYSSRANLLWASTLALHGAVGAGVVGDWTCHMLEHELSAKYDIAHGAGLAVVYPAWMELMAPRKPARFRQFAANVWGIDPRGRDDLAVAREGVAATRSFFHDTLGVGVRLSDYGIGPDRLNEMAQAVYDLKGPTGLGGLTRDDLERVYRGAV